MNVPGYAVVLAGLVETYEQLTAPAVQRFVRIITDRPVEAFLRKLLISKPRLEMLLIVSPFIGDLSGAVFRMHELCQQMSSTNTPVFVITRQPQEEYHRQGLEVLFQYDNVEVRYNPALHAKLYVCQARERAESFAMFGSGNLTGAGVQSNIELGVMIFAKGPGRDLIDHLLRWGLDLRTLSGTTLAKPRKFARRP